GSRNPIVILVTASGDFTADFGDLRNAGIPVRTVRVQDFATTGTMSRQFTSIANTHRGIAEPPPMTEYTEPEPTPAPTPTPSPSPTPEPTHVEDNADVAQTAETDEPAEDEISDEADANAPEASPETNDAIDSNDTVDAAAYDISDISENATNDAIEDDEVDEDPDDDADEEFDEETEAADPDDNELEDAPNIGQYAALILLAIASGIAAFFSVIGFIRVVV
ncbi:MAG: hypothetical protein FWF80_06810, partial [Defluviitaleaceae bacterium]|nr:hypothetical protein [Defluviitaleaceae bacterium]